MTSEAVRSINVLLVEDNPGDVRLTIEALRESKVLVSLSFAEDGEKALAFLRREGDFRQAPRPDLILLDLNLPRKDGREVLAEIKADTSLRRIPVVVLTTSRAEETRRFGPVHRGRSIHQRFLVLRGEATLLTNS
jgi:CheY-like chemotaxis protein